MQPPVSPLPNLQGAWALFVGAVLLAGAIAAAVGKVVRFAKDLAAPIHEFVGEHDVMWEDYNFRTGGVYRRRTGRGMPPDPEEFYRVHPISHSAQQDRIQERETHEHPSGRDV